ncbi:hypothetical protein CPS_1425 [Colwellia psychrerythraea 34H]|uniref:Uncharacterized protein n=1 Tax=Colwellia psychrerythraea (strain 34H / ATCC BAA-681) TaxID=167879 RepID=Q485U7_COLP3|nr:hypothetical protein CPS_1425 [Colwellia psychrerythraea 34H]
MAYLLVLPFNHTIAIASNNRNYGKCNYYFE